MEFSGLIVLIRDASQNWHMPSSEFESAMKLIAHQFHSVEQWHHHRSALTESRDHASEKLFQSLLSRAKADFAHGVFAQLQVVGLLVNNALDDLDSSNHPPVRESLHRIDGLKEEITRLMKDVLSLDNVESKTKGGAKGRPQLEEWVDADKSIKQIKEKLSRLAEMTGKEVVPRTHTPANFPMRQRDFDEVILNLVHNAIKYSGDLTKIKITLFHKPGRTIVEVISHGIEISEKNKDAIFQRGFRTAEAASITFNALGIGLYQAIRLSESAGARLFLKSSVKIDNQQVTIEGQNYPKFRNTFRLEAKR